MSCFDYDEKGTYFCISIQMNYVNFMQKNISIETSISVAYVY